MWLWLMKIKTQSQLIGNLAKMFRKYFRRLIKSQLFICNKLFHFAEARIIRHKNRGQQWKRLGRFPYQKKKYGLRKKFCWIVVMLEWVKTRKEGIFHDLQYTSNIKGPQWRFWIAFKPLEFVPVSDKVNTREGISTVPFDGKLDFAEVHLTYLG